MVRPAMVVDIWALRRKPQRRVFLYTPFMLATSYRVYAHFLRSLLGPLSQHFMTLVLRDGGLLGIVQARRRPHTPEADLLYLTAYTKQRQQFVSEGDTWFRLLEEVLRRAGEGRIERIFAAVGTRFEDVAEILHQLGFQAYAQQRLWMQAEPMVETGTTLRALRRQRSRDAHAIHQLYCSLTPRHVQQAELRRPATWQLARRRFNYRERGWVLGDDQSLTVSIQVQTGVRAHVVRLLIAPHLRDEAPALLRYVLSQLPESRPVFVLVHSYQSELEAALEATSFNMRGEQTLFVKHLALRIKQPSLLPRFRLAERPELAGPLSNLPSTGRITRR